MNKKIPEYILGKYQTIGTVTFSVLFALVFLNIYIPFSDTAWFGLGASTMFFPTIVFITSSIATLIASRITMYKTQSFLQLTYFEYAAWCIVEIMLISGIYTWITIDLSILPEQGWSIYQRSFMYVLIALGIPYIISGMRSEEHTSELQSR